MPVRRSSGPIEDFSFPTEIEARVITPGSAPRIHGYSVEADLACHYRFSEMALLCLTGEVPEKVNGCAFDIALQFLAPVSIGEAPTHAAALAKICGASTSSLTSAATIALAERARYIVARYTPLIEWLKIRTGELPAEFRSRGDDDRASVLRLRMALAQVGAEVPDLFGDPERLAALFIVLDFAGLRRADQFEMVLVFASLMSTLAEANAHEPASFRRYPMNLPPFHYEEEP